MRSQYRHGNVKICNIIKHEEVAGAFQPSESSVDLEPLNLYLGHLAVVFQSQVTPFAVAGSKYSLCIRDWGLHLHNPAKSARLSCSLLADRDTALDTFPM